VIAAVVPATPERSLVNSAVYRDEGAFMAAYDALRSAYDEAGIAAWSVWAPDLDAATIELLKAKGHSFDGEPLAMTLDLEGWSAEAGDLDWDAEASLDELGRLNDEAYGFDRATGYTQAFGPPPDDLAMRLYRARDNGETASVMATIDHGEDVGIYYVATRERARGKGLATRLLGAALNDAVARGMRTSSLQASAKGAGIYERLGYRRHFRLQLYERRR
jgi:GNAT superfamily N-acetyltransferase